MLKPQWQEFCVICGGPPSVDPRSCAAGQSGASRIPTAWLNEWVGVTPEQPDEPIDIGSYGHRGCWRTDSDSTLFAARGEYEWSIAPNERRHDGLHGPPGSCECVENEAAGWDPEGQEDEDGWYERVACPGHAPASGLHWLEDSARRNTGWVRYGVAFHRACGQVLQQRLGYRLNFNHVWPLLQQQQPSAAAAQPEYPSTNHFYNRSYGGTEWYHARYESMHPGAVFLSSYVSAEDEYLLLDPLQCSGNADRIVCVWEPLVKQWERAQRRSRAHPAPAAAAAGGQVAGGQGQGSGSDGGRSSSRRGNDARSSGGAATERNGRGTAGDRGDGSAGGAAGAATPAGGAGPSSSALQVTGRVTRSADAQMKAIQLHKVLPTVLELVFTHAGSPKAQLALAAKLLPLSSTMPQLLAGCMQLAAAAHTLPKVQQVLRWLRSYGCLLNSLALDAAVDCCPQDAERSNTSVLEAIEEAKTKHQAFRLVSLSLHIPLSADTLLQSLPLAHLTALHLPGPWELSAQAAAALAAATALQQLTLPGAGLEDALAAEPRVLPAGLQRLRLCDAGGCSAATLRALSGQLSALTHLSLDYNPLGEEDDEGEGVVSAVNNNVLLWFVDGSMVLREAGECWAELPALRSLQLGARPAPPLSDLGFAKLPLHRRLLPLSVGRHTLNSIAAVPGLTSLTLGPSVWLEGHEAGGTGLKWLLTPLQELTGLQQLTLTLQVVTLIATERDRDRLDRDQCAVMTAVAELPELSHLAVGVYACGPHIGCLAAARQLTRVVLDQGEWCVREWEPAVTRFAEEWPSLLVRQ